MIKKILIALGALGGLYVVLGFFYPIVPLSSDRKDFLSQTSYSATWTQVYKSSSMLSTMSGDVKIPRTALQGVTPWNAKQRNKYVVTTKDSVYFYGEKLEGVDVSSLTVVAPQRFGNTLPPLYLADKNNVYIGTNTIIPLNGGNPTMVYAQYMMDRHQERIDTGIEKSEDIFGKTDSATGD